MQGLLSHAAQPLGPRLGQGRRALPEDRGDVHAGRAAQEVAHGPEVGAARVRLPRGRPSIGEGADEAAIRAEGADGLGGREEDGPTGALKCLVFLNNWILRSNGIASLLFLASIPGMALVTYSHNELGMTEPADLAPPAVVCFCLMIIAASGFGGGGKSKTN